MDADTIKSEFERRAIKNFGTIAEAFEQINRLVKETHEAKRLFELLLGRLETARTKLQTATTTEAEDARGRFEEALEKFVMLVSPYPNAVLADRVIQHIKLKNQLWRIHDTLDGFFRVADINEENDKWREETYEATKIFFAALAATVDDNVKLTEELRDAFVYHESLTILRHAKESRDLDKWNALAQKMYDLALRLDVNPELQDEGSSKVPSWFVPASDVVYNRKPFAKGSFGSVHHGVWGPGTKVVVKVLLDSGRMETLLMNLFLKEANLWAKFTFPYVSRMFGACHVSSPPFFICEDATNGNLSNYLAAVEKPETKVWRLLYQVALGIHYLHSKKVIHRDLKLNNILVGREGYARVTDFGLSRIHEDKQTKSMSKLPDGSLVDGAIRWRAPECFSENPDDVGFEADVYSFGLCIYEAFKGQIPYSHLNSNDAVKQSIVAGKIPDKPEKMDSNDWELVVGMLETDKAKRSNLDDVIAELKVRAEKEESVERDSILLCEKCDTKLPTDSNFCNRCGVHVKSKPAIKEVVRISSPNDIGRAIHLLNVSPDELKISAARGLINYVFGEPAHQTLVHEAGAVPILIRLVKESTNEDVRVECVLALGSIYAVNEPIQNTAEYEGAIGALKMSFDRSAENEKAKAAMAIGLLADSNDEIVKKLGQSTIDGILALKESPDSTLKRAGENAAEFLEAFAPDNQLTSSS